MGELERAGYAFDPATVSRTSAFIDDHHAKRDGGEKKMKKRKREFQT